MRRDQGLLPSVLKPTVASVATVLSLGARRGEFVKTDRTRGARWSIANA
jgi:hypothetical protein